MYIYHRILPLVEMSKDHLEPTKNEDNKLSYTSEANKLPYNADIALLDKILNDLKTTSAQGISLGTLWANVGNPPKFQRSYTLGLGTFVGVIDHDSKRIWSTELGTTLRYMTKDDKNRTLAAKLPERYLTMLKWIIGEKEVSPNNLKRQFIETWGSLASRSLLDRSITTFLHYCRWLELITYSGRGLQAKAVITEFGTRALDTPTTNTADSNTNENLQNDALSVSDLDKVTVYPMIIKTGDRNFNWDIKSEPDWAVIDSVIASIKEDWKRLQIQPVEEGNK